MHSDGTAFEQTVCTTFGNQIALQAIRAISGNGITEQWIGLSRGSNSVAEQWIGLSRRSNSIAKQWICLSSGGNSIQCEQRESEAEEGLAFHVDVLRVQWLGMEPILRRVFDMRT